MVFYINSGVCCSDIPLSNMVFRESAKYILMEYRNEVVTGKFYIERGGIQELYDELDSDDFIESEKIPLTYKESIHDFKRELVVMMALID